MCRENRKGFCQCGCGKRVRIFKGKPRQFLWGHSSYKHGQSRDLTTEYVIWTGMKTRCTNPNIKEYPSYGGRGIKICKRWMYSFVNFFADMGARPKGKTLDRRNNDGDYKPSNRSEEHT